MMILMVCIISLISISFGCVSAAELDQTNSTAVLTTDNSQSNIIDDVVDDNLNNDEDLLSDSLMTDDDYNQNLESDDILSSTENDILGDSVSLTLVSGSTTCEVGDTVYLKMSSEANNYVYSWDGTTVYIRDDGKDYSTVTYRQATSSTGAPVTFNSAGTYKIQFCVFTNGPNYYSNIIEFTVSDAKKLQETQTSLILNTSSVKPGNYIKITPTVIRTDTNANVLEGNIEIYINGVCVDTIKSGESFDYTSSIEDSYLVYAKYLGSDDFNSSVSETQSFLVNKDDSLIPTNLDISLDKTSIKSDGSIVVTIDLKDNNGQAITGTVSLFDGEDNLIDQVNGNTYVYTPGKTDGDYVIYAKYLGNEDLKYAPSVSSKVNYKVQNRAITLTVNGYENVKAGLNTGIVFDIDSDIEYTSIDYYLNGEKFGSTSDDYFTITFDDTDPNPSTVYVKLGDVESNIVILNFVTPLSTTVKVSANTTNAVVGEKVLITPVVTDANGNEVTEGVIYLYDTTYVSYSSPIATLNAGESYEYTTTSTGSKTFTAVYLAYVSDKQAYAQSSASSSVLSNNGVTVKILNKNTISLTGNGETGNITIKFGETLTLNVKIDYFSGSYAGYDSNYNTIYNTNIMISFDDDNEWDYIQSSSSYSTSGIYPYDIEFGDVGDEGLHTIYVYYKGDNSYAPCTSNVLYVNVVKDTTLSLTGVTTKVSPGENIVITPNVVDSDGKRVTVGNITYTDENGNILAIVPVSDNFEINNMTVGNHTITARYDGAKGYSPSDVKSVAVEVSKRNLVITLTREGDGVVVKGDTVYFTITYSDSVSDNISLWNGDNRLFGEDGSSSTSIGSSYYVVGANSVYVNFTGNDMYNPTVSNVVEFDVYQSVSVILGLDTNVSFVVEGDKVLFTPSATYYSGGYKNAPGNVLIYADSALSELIGNVSVGDSYEYVIPVSDGDVSSYRQSFYAVYEDTVDDYSIYKMYRQSSKTITILRSNSMILSSDKVVLKVGENVSLHVDIDFWKAVSSYDYSKGTYVYRSDIVINVNGVDKFVFSLVSNSLNDTLISFDEAGEYTVYAYYKGFNASSQYDSSYAPARSNSIVISVSAIKGTNLTLTGVNTTVDAGESIVIVPSVLDADGNAVLEGNVTFTDENGNVLAVLPVGETFTINNLTVGNHTISANYGGTDNYGPSDVQSIDVEVKEIIYSFSISVDNVEYPNAPIAIVTVGQAGNYSITVNGKKYDNLTFDKEGSQTVNLDKLDAGDNYEAVISFNGQTNKTLFNVTKGINKVVISVDEVTLPDMVNITVTATVDGIYTVTISDGSSHEVSVIGGNGSKMVKLAEGKYSANTTFDDANYDTSITNASFTVYPEPVLGNISIRDSKYPSNSTVVVICEGNYSALIEYLITKPGYSLASPQVDVYINGVHPENMGVYVESEIVYGSYASIASSIILNESGIYEVKFVYKSVNLPPLFTGVELESNVIVYNITIENKPVKEDIEMNIESTSPVEGENATVSITLPANATGNVTVAVGDKLYNASLKDGKAVIEVPDLPSGENKVVISYSGDDNYNGNATDFIINVSKAPSIKETKLTGDKLEMFVKDGSKFTVTLKDEDGNPVEGKIVKISIVGKTYSCRTNAEGIAQLPINLNPRSYEVSAVFAGDDKYNKSNTISTKVEVLTKVRISQNKDLVKDYLDNSKPYKVRALNKYGKAAGAGEIVKMTVCGKTYSVRTDKNGYATLPINLLPGTFTITVNYAGYKVSNKITVKQVIKANHASYKKAKTYKYSATLKYSNGKAISAKKVSFMIKGKTYTANTNSKGVATITINQNLKVGKYTITAKYEKSSLSKTITIK